MMSAVIELFTQRGITEYAQMLLSHLLSLLQCKIGRVTERKREGRRKEEDETAFCTEKKS